MNELGLNKNNSEPKNWQTKNNSVPKMPVNQKY